MQVDYKFVRLGRIPAFAHVAVSFERTDSWEITCPTTVSGVLKFFQADVEAGISLAIEEARKRGLTPRRIQIVSLAIAPADTRADAVRCAAAVAAWMAVGGNSDLVKIDHDGTGWSVSSFGAESE